MKKFTGVFIALFLLCFVSVYDADAGVRWPFGAVNTVANDTSNDTLDISSSLTRGLNYYDISNDTNMVLNVTTINTEWATGDLLIIEATEGSTSADTIRYGTNITGTYTAIPSGKTTIITFIFNSSAWVKQSEVQID